MHGPLTRRAVTTAVTGVAVVAAALSAGCGTTVPLAEQQASLEAGTVAASGTGAASAADRSRSQARGAVPVAAGDAGSGGGAVPPPSNQAAGAAPPANTTVGTGAVAGPVAHSGTPMRTGATGPGWNAHDVYIGFPTENDTQQAIAAIGISFNPGNENDDANAIINYLNARGGLLGRRIIPVFHDNSTASIESDPNSVAQQNCSYFGQDERVAEVVNFLPDIFIAGCLQQQHVPDIEGSSVIFDSQYYSRYGPYLWTSLFPNVDKLAPSLVDQLQSERYFTSWNTTTGSAGAAPVKVGILEPDTPVGKDLASHLTARLQARHEDVASTFYYSDSTQSYGSEMSSAVLQFAAAGVSHVINIPPIAAALLFFAESAESQHYRPRYAVTSYTLPSQAAGDVPSGQLNGAVGIGWFPGDDVAMAQAPAPDPAAQTCDAALKQDGVSYTSELPTGNAWAICDAVTLFSQAATAGGGFSPGDLSAGIAVIGSRFAPAATFGSSLSSSDHSLPGVVRDLAYMPSCSCFEYTSPGQPLGSS